MMKILVVGGGPAGVYFAYLLKRACPGHHVLVAEQKQRGEVDGGVVLREATLQSISATDAALGARIASDGESCDYLEVVHRRQGVRIHGNPFCRLPMARLLSRLESACERVGVSLQWGRGLSLRDLSADWDMVVLADGHASRLRADLASGFAPRFVAGRSQVARFATRALFHPVSLIVVSTGHGAFIAHCYQYDRSHSEFIVECPPRAWADAGLDRMGDEARRAYCEQVFEEELDGESLLGAPAWSLSPWGSNARASYERFVLIGDAHRTVHFSLGSGIAGALDDATALSAAVVAAGDDAAAALRLHARRRAGRPHEMLSARSAQWLETVDERMHLSPQAFAYDYMTRTGEVSDDTLRRMDPAFAGACELDLGRAAGHQDVH